MKLTWILSFKLPWVYSLVPFHCCVCNEKVCKIMPQKCLLCFKGSKTNTEELQEQ